MELAAAHRSARSSFQREWRLHDSWHPAERTPECLRRHLLSTDMTLNATACTEGRSIYEESFPSCIERVDVSSYPSG